jgi:hypothetical protein
MARANLGDMFGAPDQAQQPAAPEPRIDAPRPIAPTAPSAANDGSDTKVPRINFEVPRELRNAFKAWCNTNDTTIKDELTAYIRRCLADS